MAKTKTLISCAVTAQLICVFVFAYANCWFSHAAAHVTFLISEQGEIAEEEEEESWEEIERKMEQKKQEQELERKTDELYDNMKMAFR